GRNSDIEPASQPVFLAPAGRGWNLVRARQGNGSWDVRQVADLKEAADLLEPGEDFVLGLPISAVIAQRLRLPSADPADFEGMVRLQVEKAFPYPPEEVTSD